MKSETVIVDLGDRSYPICIQPGILKNIGDELNKLSPGSEAHLVVVTDEVVAPLYLETTQTSLLDFGHRVSTVVLPDGEKTKSIEYLDKLWQQLVAFGTDRSSTIVALGGGVVGDLAGMVAATFNRGLKFVQIPTTLLAQVDSSVGGKTGINLPQGKNLVGAFWQPTAVFIDPNVLSTLQPRDFRSGLAEVVKYGVIMDFEFFERLENNAAEICSLDPNAILDVIRTSCQSKAQVVFEDEKEESGRRAILNYGHTFGHAIESVYGYGKFTHGEAISIGMTCAARLAVQLGHVTEDMLERQTGLLRTFELPVECPVQDRPQLIAAMKHDKKVAHGQLQLVLPTKIGNVELVNAPSDELLFDCLG